jgi:hypothetical protein
MKKSHFFGLWAEHYGEGYPLLLEQPENTLSESEAIRIAHYLKSCPLWIYSPGIIYSSFQNGDIAGSGSILTDGIWAWDDTMAYYVLHHRISPPSGFINHLRHKKYIPPSDKEVDVVSLKFPSGI